MSKNESFKWQMVVVVVVAGTWLLMEMQEKRSVRNVIQEDKKTNDSKK